MNIDTMFPDELEHYITGNDKKIKAAVVPIGSIEQHGPHLLLGTDGFIAYVLAHMTSQKLGGVLFPMIPLSWIGGLRPYAGTIDMRPFITADYMEQIGLNIFRQGFSHLILVNSHGGGREMVFSVARRLYKKVGKPVITEYPSNFYDKWPEIIDIWKSNGMDYDWAAFEAAQLIAALEYIDKNDMAEKVKENLKNALSEYGESVQIPDQPGLYSVFKLGEAGHDYNHECMHVQPRVKVTAKAGMGALDFMAEKLAWMTHNVK